eukprot:CAMPEP_0113846006 /NCGR_PEP_ID=MMETSP0372-20130328/1067_1 /TAXON_ID=340204 /ORGANISM="Lankesteria abbotti" /LENGTH=219 /DNA_ID=CAMNT_0000815101 /DNA_START=232 /DNA_END=891 /DNA_ORIENTATION=+ /assembly_acc=CAM_ASM_000359
MAAKYDCLIKLLLIGDSGVGKSCLLVRLSDNQFCSSHITTIGIDFKVKFMDVDGTRVKLQIWDTAGQERFRTITQAYYRSAMGILVVYDESNAESFENARSWIEQIEQHTGTQVEMILVGNKADLPTNVPEGAPEALAREYNISWHRTSAMTGAGVEDAFAALAGQVVSKIKSGDTTLAGARDADVGVKVRSKTLTKTDHTVELHGKPRSGGSGNACGC